MRLNAQKYVARLHASPACGQGRNYGDSEIADLPASVKKYFRMVLRPGQPLIEMARICHAGGFRMTPSNAGWRPFRSTEYFSVTPPGFVWDAYIQAVPGVPVHVIDSYIEREASMRANILAFIPVANVAGLPELASGALQRYLAEAVWFPTALLPSHGVQWQEIDELTAMATLVDGENAVSLEFHFNREGEITEAYSPARYREVRGAFQRTPWLCRYANYADREGIRIPLEGEVEWHLPDGPLPYWRGHVISVNYEYARRATVRTVEVQTERNELCRAQSAVPHR